MPVCLSGWSAPQRNQRAIPHSSVESNLRTHFRLWIIGLMLPCLLLGAEPPAESLPVEIAAPAPPTASSTAPAARPTRPAPTPEQKRKVVVLTSLMMLGILAVVFCLFLWILWWSRRTHRLLRQPLPSANRGDELWYLKGKGTPPQNDERQPLNRPPTPPSA